MGNDLLIDVNGGSSKEKWGFEEIFESGKGKIALGMEPRSKTAGNGGYTIYKLIKTYGEMLKTRV